MKDHFGREKFCYLLFYYALMLPDKGRKGGDGIPAVTIIKRSKGKFYVLDSFVGVEREAIKRW
jgi:hypothetical protein